MAKLNKSGIKIRYKEAKRGKCLVSELRVVVFGKQAACKLFSVAYKFLTLK